MRSARETPTAPTSTPDSGAVGAVVLLVGFAVDVLHRVLDPRQREVHE